MTIEIVDFNHVVDRSIQIAILLLSCFVGMRILYGYWPWQSGPKQSIVEEKSGPLEFLPLSEIERERLLEPKTNGVAVAAAFVEPMNAPVKTESFDRQLIKTDEQTKAHAALQISHDELSCATPRHEVRS
jgi:hypothetical protein